MLLRLFSSTAATLLVAAFLSSPAAGAVIAYAGLFDDSTGQEAAGDSLILDNLPGSESFITEVVIDLTTASSPVFFDPADSPFTPTLGSDVITGLVSAALSGGNQILTLVFSGFAPGETFSFTIDADDNNNRVDASRIAGSTVTARFAAGGGTPLATTMVAGSGRSASWNSTSNVPVPEPSSGALLGLGLTALVWRERQATRRRATR